MEAREAASAAEGMRRCVMAKRTAKELTFECGACNREFSWREDHYSVAVQRFVKDGEVHHMHLRHFLEIFCSRCVDKKKLSGLPLSDYVCIDCGEMISEGAVFWNVEMVLRRFEDDMAFPQWRGSLAVWCEKCAEGSGGIFHGQTWCRRCGSLEKDIPFSQLNAALRPKFQKFLNKPYYC
jgi:hypothetical protein